MLVVPGGAFAQEATPKPAAEQKDVPKEAAPKKAPSKAAPKKVQRKTAPKDAAPKEAAPEAKAEAEQAPEPEAAAPRPGPYGPPRDLTFGQQDAYGKLLEDADAELELGNWQDARANYQAAHDLQPGALTDRGLGRVSVALGEFAPAVLNFEAVLATTWDALQDAEKAEVERWLLDARVHIGSYILETDPPGARVAIDGTYTTLEDGALVLSIGKHVIRASAPGRDSAELRIVVSGGEDKARLLLKLPVTGDMSARAAARAGSSFDPDHVADDADSDGLLTQWWFWTAVSAAVAGGVLTAVLVSDAGTEAGASRVEQDVAGQATVLRMR